MPYIDRIKRQGLTPVTPDPATNAGELNFQVTCLIQDYVKNHGLKYETLNAVVGALESAKAEFQRRVVAPYEDEKRGLNGDVYEDVLETMRQLYRGQS